MGMGHATAVPNGSNESSDSNEKQHRQWATARDKRATLISSINIGKQKRVREAIGMRSGINMGN
eukprot:1509705-Prorocentrum_lima.AAC.1